MWKFEVIYYKKCAKKSTFCMFRGQKTAATSYRTTRLFLFFMTNLYLKQPQRGSNVKWGSSKTSFRIFSLCLSVPFWLPKEMGHVQIGRFLYTPIYLAAKNVVFWMGTIFVKLLQEHKWICHITSDMTYSWVFKVDYFILPLFLVPKLRSVAQNEWKKHRYIFFLLLVQK